MNIEVPEQGRMTETGSSLLRLIQNTNTPILDLFVRESIQNSLDAHLNDDPVRVDFFTGKFNNKEFAMELEGVSDALLRKNPNSEYDYIAIKDSNTKGLIGPMIEEGPVSSEDNLLKLVYHISKPQTTAGAGGSWGLGKTVYFRVGIGFVIYYSRINNGKEFEDRLVVTLVEDETGQKGLPLLDSLTKKSKRGIAWWGKEIENNKTIPITDENEIARILGYFNLSLFEKNETGTMVIIPYIDKQKLCKVNKFEGNDGNTKYSIPTWCKNEDVIEYLEIASQRWYCCRMNQDSYKYGPSLNVYINGDPVVKMEPLFQLFHDFYSYANTEKWEVASDYPFEKPNDPYKVELSKFFNNGKGIAGTLVYSKIPVSKQMFDYNPLLYINEIPENNDTNPPIVAFTRQPGMIVSYDIVGDWVKGIPDTNSNEIIVALFVLNSSKSLLLRNSVEETSLESYVRLSENADHFSWHNHYLCYGVSDLIISSIQTKVRTEIKDSYSAKKDNSGLARNDAVGEQLAKALLPKRGYGNGASGRRRKKSNKNDTPITRGSQKGIKVFLNDSEIEYTEDKMLIPFYINCPIDVEEKSIQIKIMLDSESKKISILDWEEKMNLLTPFEIDSIKIVESENDEKINFDSISFASTESRFHYGQIKMLSKKKNTNYGITITHEMTGVKYVVLLTVAIKNRNYQPLFEW